MAQSAKESKDLAVVLELSSTPWPGKVSHEPIALKLCTCMRRLLLALSGSCLRLECTVVECNVLDELVSSLLPMSYAEIVGIPSELHELDTNRLSKVRI